VSCPDQKGVVAALAQLLYGYGVNIITSDQFSDTAEQMYFQRITLDFGELIVGVENVNVLENAMKNTASRFDMTWSIHYPAKCVAQPALRARSRR
jgi:formyltetrahydrofolate deformylase